MNGDTYDYRFGQKNNWRRTIWNRIVERLSGKVKDALVLYLPGREDLDRQIAIEKGFNPNNMICVDKDAALVRCFRKQGKLAIHGDIVDVVEQWSGKTYPDVIFADLCCGFTRSAIKLGVLLTYRFPMTVFAVNMMRGREAYTGDAALLKKYFVGRHRAQCLFGIWRGNVLEGICHGHSSWAGDDSLPTIENCDPVSQCPHCAYNPTLITREESTPWWMANHWLDNLSHTTVRPYFAEYKSTSGQVFDSAVWVNLNWRASRAYQLLRSAKLLKVEERIHARAEAFCEKIGTCSAADPKHPIARKIVALRAVMTQRANKG
jgi:hypothetical protein